MSQEAYDFLEQEREVMRLRMEAIAQAGDARRAARRVPLMPAEAVEVTAIFMGTPTGVSRLERQNALRALVP